MSKSDREKAQEICNLTHHDYAEEYDGYRCRNCDDFIPYGCAPWEWSPDEPEPVCDHCGKPLEDFSDLGCEYCDARHPYFGIVL